MFSKLFGSFRNQKEDKPAIDLSLGYVRTAEFKTYLVKGKYEIFENEYAKLSWDEKSLLNEGIGLDLAFTDPIKKWVTYHPDSYIACLFAGVSKTALAWVARTAALGEDVPEEKGELFFSFLTEAAEHLEKADNLNPSDAEICARMIRVYMGLNAGEEAAFSYFNASAALVPAHLISHLMMINYVSPKWHGSTEKMHAFANQRYQDAGSSLLVVLKLFAFTEEWLYRQMVNEPYADYFKNEALKTEIMNLYTGYKEEPEGRLLIPYVYNYFAFLMHMTGERMIAKELLGKIAGKMTIYPWAYLDVNNNEDLKKKIG